MKAYLWTTGTVFGLVAVAHLVRMVLEWPHAATEPLYVLLTVAAVGLCIWAFYLIPRLSRS